MAVHDEDEPISALIFARVDAFKYDKTLVMADNLSIQEYSVVIGGADGLPETVDVRLKRAEVDAYNSGLTKDRTVSSMVELPFIAVTTTATGTVLEGNLIKTFAAYVTDQAGNSAADKEDVEIIIDDVKEDGEGGDEDVDSDEGIIPGVPATGATTGYLLEVKDDDGLIIPGTNDVERSDETIELTVTATVAQNTVANPFAGDVFFYAQVGSRISTKMATLRCATSSG